MPLMPNGLGVKELCGHTKKDGSTCRQAAGMGTQHKGHGRCKWHGGNTPSEIKAQAKAALKRGDLWYGDPVDITPEEAVLEEVRRTAGHVRFLEEQIATLSSESLLTDDLPEDEARTSAVRREEAKRRYEYLYPLERAHLLKVCQVAMHAGVEERRVRVAERIGNAMAVVLQGVLRDLKLSPKQIAAAPGIVKLHMNQLEAGVE